MCLFFRIPGTSILYASPTISNLFHFDGDFYHWQRTCYLDFFHVSNVLTVISPSFILLQEKHIQYIPNEHPITQFPIHFVHSSKSLRSASNMFIVNLAIFDLLMMLEMPMFIANSFHERLLGYELGCTIYAALGSLSGILSFVVSHTKRWIIVIEIDLKSIKYLFCLFYGIQESVNQQQMP